MSKTHHDDQWKRERDRKALKQAAERIKRMDVLRLARISGHKDLNQLLAAYYRDTAADVAATI